MGQKAALALDGPEQMELNPDPEKTKASGGQKGLCPTPQKHIPSPLQASPIDIDATRSGFSIMYSPPVLSLVEHESTEAAAPDCEAPTVVDRSPIVVRRNSVRRSFEVAQEPLGTLSAPLPLR